MNNINNNQISNRVSKNTKIVAGIVLLLIIMWGGYRFLIKGVDQISSIKDGGKTSSPTSTEPIKIGAILSLTGNGAAYGEPARDGLNLAVQQIGSINGRKIEIVYEDSQFDPKVAISAYRSLAARGVRYFFSNGSSVSTALKGPVVTDGNFNFELGAVTPLYRDGKPNTCRAALTADVSGKALGEFIVKTLKLKTVGFLILNDEFGTAMYDNMRSTIDGAGIVITGVERFGKSDTDFRTQITKLITASSRPDGLIVIPTAGQAQPIFTQLAEQKWNGVTISDNWTVINQQLKNLSLVEGVYFSNYNWSPTALATDETKKTSFKVAFREKYSYDSPVMAANAYDSFSILAEGFKNSDPNDPLVLGSWLTKNIKNFSGVNGMVSLDDDCEGSREVVIQQVKDGQFVIMK